MNGTLLKALVALVPASALFCRSLVFFSRSRSVGSSLQLLGAGGFVTVVLTHEALNLFPWMQWGLEHSAGHYLDLVSAVLGVTLFSLGYFFDMLSKRRA